MKFIGITGGVGAGKSEVLAYLKRNYEAYILRADEVSHILMQKNGKCFPELSAHFEGQDVFRKDGAFDRRKLAKVIFSDDAARAYVNSVLHPAVKEEILRIVAEEREKETPYFFLEAALLLEEGYDRICDEIWYVYASEETRRERLKKNRRYSDKKIDSILKNQLTDAEFRDRVQAVIENDGSPEELSETIRRQMEWLEKKDRGQGEEKTTDIAGAGIPEAADSPILKAEENSIPETEETGIPETGDRDWNGEEKAVIEAVENKAENQFDGQDLVFGLDIGTRNVVGTVGQITDDGFYVMAQCSKEHESRAMLDGQIHDINRVAGVITAVKENLEDQLSIKLKDVCIAAAGRVLRTITTRVKYTYEEETMVTDEDLHTLDLMGIDKAQKELKELDDSKYKFYCVGYSVMKYYLNGDMMVNIEGHKAEEIEEDIIVTFLPEDVVDGLYTAVERSGLSVANLTLEPIAAINVAIPENFRLLNIALVDVGAGTSDICITRDGSIIAYGMIPYAGDELTEVLVQEYLVDFATAETIKKESVDKKQITFEDIMGLSHTIDAEEVWKLTDPVCDKITTAVSDRIKELNGNKSVSAAFVVGGGGKVHGFCETLAEKLGIAKERVALRGEEVMKSVTFAQKDVKKDPLLVTPIGICLNYYEQKNNFIMVHFNDEMLKL